MYGYQSKSERAIQKKLAKGKALNRRERAVVQRRQRAIQRAAWPTGRAVGIVQNGELDTETIISTIRSAAESAHSSASEIDWGEYGATASRMITGAIGPHPINKHTSHRNLRRNFTGTVRLRVGPHTPCGDGPRHQRSGAIVEGETTLGAEGGTSNSTSQGSEQTRGSSTTTSASATAEGSASQNDKGTSVSGGGSATGSISNTESESSQQNASNTESITDERSATGKAMTNQQNMKAKVSVICTITYRSERKDGIEGLAPWAVGESLGEGIRNEFGDGAERPSHPQTKEATLGYIYWVQNLGLSGSQVDGGGSS